MKNGSISNEMFVAASQNTRARDYWISQLSGEWIKSNFHHFSDKSNKKERLIQQVTFEFPNEFFSKVMELSGYSDYRLHITLVAGLTLLIYKYTSNKDIIVGTTIYNQEIDGEFVNTLLPLRNQVVVDLYFKEFLLGVAQRVFEANDNQNYPMETLLHKLNKISSGDDFPLFDIAVILENIHNKNYLQHINLKILFRFTRTNYSLEGTVEYDASHYKKKFIEKMMNHFSILLEQCISDLYQRLSQIEILSAAEKKQILIDFNNNRCDFSVNKAIVHLIEEQADLKPGSIAVRCEDHEVTYKNIIEESYRMSNYLLQEQHVNTDEGVGILMERSINFIIAILGIWKARAVYFPLSPDMPPERLKIIIDDSTMRIILSQKKYIDTLYHMQRECQSLYTCMCTDSTDIYSEKEMGNCIQMDKDSRDSRLGMTYKYQHDRCILKRYGSDKVRPGEMLNLHDLAYVIYTSGSTGKPKGVMVEHRGMLNHIQSKVKDLELTDQSIVSQNASQIFDISVWQLMTALILGGKTIIYPDNVILEPGIFIRKLINDGVTILEVVPSYLSVMFDILLKESGPLPLFLKYLLVTGEEVKPHLVNRWFELYPCIKMVNAYGPTEASDDITHYMMDRPLDKDRIPIGRPLQNLEVYILDENMKLCPVGIPGEICVSGIGVGRGYLNDPQKTMRAFCYNSFKPQKEKRLYKTGDLGCWLLDGTVEFLGRKDYQVKIRGYRIELGEIELKLLENPLVKEAVVIDCQDSSEGKYLCAYIVPVTEERMNILELKEYLNKKLPGYMVPAYFVDLKELPLTPNGKINRNALPDPAKAKSMAFIPYMTEDELKQKILHCEKISPKIERVAPAIQEELGEQRTEQNEKKSWNENKIYKGSSTDGIEAGEEEEKKSRYWLTREERHQVIEAFNATRVELPTDKTLVDLLAVKVVEFPHRRAVVYKDEMVTYRELDRRIMELAGLLKLRGITANHIVGLMLENSPEMVVGIYAIMKVGGAFLPIDIEYPEERQRFMLKDTNTRWLLTLQKYKFHFDSECEVIDMEDVYLQEENAGEPGYINPPADLAYIAFTSGSTGKPKGTAIGSGGFLNFIHWFVKEFAFNTEDKVLLTTSISFDLTYRKIFAPLITGGTLCITALNHYDPKQVLHEIIQHRVSWMSITPSMFCQLMEFEDTIRKLISLRYVFFSGEALNITPLQQWIESNYFFATLINTYGATECTCFSTYYQLQHPGKYERKTVPGGKPINNTQVFVLGKDFNPLPVGIMGEILIGGKGLAKGYINDIQLTRRKFITITTFNGKNRLYRTGDFGRWLPEGNIEFLGRMDSQVKIRGFRIEPGEIENVLLKTKNIKKAAVVIKEEPDAEKYLCAFLVSEHPLLEVEMRESLLSQLPLFMIPSRYVQLEKMPLTPNGKVDRRHLEVIDINFNTKETFQAPRNEMEEKVADVWSEVLRIDKNKISIDDNFFESGGHSLNAIILITRIHKILNIKVPLAVIFKTPSIRKIVEYIEIDTSIVPFQSISPTEKKEYYPLSSGQKRLYIMQQLNEGNIVYNMPKFVQLEGNIDIGYLEKVFLILIHRHEILRTSLSTESGEPMQRVNENVEFKIQNHIVSPKHTNLVDEIIRAFIRPFDLSQAPMIRIGLIKFKEMQNKHILMVDLHHIISDGTSHNVLIRDFINLYKSKKISPLKLQYKDFSEWQNKLLNSKKMKSQETYWLNKFKGDIPELNMSLLVDYPRSDARNLEGDTVSFELDEKLTLMIKKLVEETDTTVFIILMTAFYILLSKYTGQDDIIIGTGIVGRDHADLENIIGLFVNMLAIRNQPSEDKSFQDFLMEVKKNATEAYENQGYPFDELVKQLGEERKINKHPVFNTQFTFQNDMFESKNKKEFFISNLEIKPYPIAYDGWQSEFDLSLTGFQDRNKIMMAVHYMKSLFKRSTIQGMVNNYIEVLEEVLRNENVKIKEITLSHDLLFGESGYCHGEYVEFTF